MESSLAVKLGKRIREIRLSKGLKQSGVADLLEMERSNYTRIENGKQSPSDRNLEKIAMILGVSLKDLYDFEHLKSKDELVDLITELLPKFTEKELQYTYKMLLNLKQLK